MTDDEKSEIPEDPRAHGMEQIERMLVESMSDVLYDMMERAHFSGDHDRRNQLLGELGMPVEEWENIIETSLNAIKEEPEWQEMSNVEKAELISHFKGENPDYDPGPESFDTES